MTPDPEMKMLLNKERGPPPTYEESEMGPSGRPSECSAIDRDRYVVSDEVRRTGRQNPFIYAHTVLAISATPLKTENIAEVDKKLEEEAAWKFGQCTLHHWNHLDPGESSVIETSLTPENLSHVEGFRELGTFYIGVSGLEHSAEFDPDEFLTSLVFDATGSSVLVTDDEIISAIMERLRQPQNSNLPLIAIHLYSVSIHGGDTTTLFSGPEALWKWTKPTSVYRPKSGYWTASVDETVLDGEWIAGKDLKVLVHGVTDEYKYEVTVRGERRMKLDVELGFLET